MIPSLVAAVGLSALAIGLLVLRSLGASYRVGRLLAVTPKVSVEEALVLATEFRPPYVRIDGRVDAEDEFEDADHRPLVLRRTRVEVQHGRAWTIIEDGREAIPFEIREGLSGIAVDASALGPGLVVVPRESRGVAADLPDRVPSELPPGTPVRIAIEQLSSVDHATVLGVPVPGAAGRPWMTSGRGRPLILTNLETAEAMRILVGDRRMVPVAATAWLGSGLVLLAIAVVLAVAGVR